MPFSEHEFGIALGYTPSGVDDDSGGFDPSYFYAERQFADNITYEDGEDDAVIQFSNEVLDVADEYAPGTGIFTATNAGVYEFNVHLGVLNGAAELSAHPLSGVATFRLIKNASDILMQISVRSNDTEGATAANIPVHNGHTLVSLAAGDTVKVKLIQLSDMDYTPDFTSGGCFFWGRRVA